MVKFSESLALENADAGVHAAALCPGFTWSEFHDVTGTRAMMSRLPRWLWLDAADVARAGVEGAERGEVVIVPGAVYRALRVATRLLPERFLLRRMAKHSARIRSTE